MCDLPEYPTDLRYAGTDTEAWEANEVARDYVVLLGPFVQASLGWPTAIRTVDIERVERQTVECLATLLNEVLELGNHRYELGCTDLELDCNPDLLY